MNTFLTGKQLEDKLTDIVWNAKKYVVIISPFIKLDDYVRSVFEKIRSTHETHIILLFGKNEGYKGKSFHVADYEYFKEFKNISILYNKDLHAKQYFNEKEGLITSLNLYDYSMVNNIEFGVYFSNNILNPTDKLYEDAARFTHQLIYEKSDAVFVKRPQYKKKMLGFTKSYQDSKILFDISEEFFKNNKYERKHLNEFNYEQMADVEKIYNKKPQRETMNAEVEVEVLKSIEELSKAKTNISTGNTNSYTGNENPGLGYCIRCNDPIKYDYEKPYCWDCYSTWAKFGNYEYEENVCHSCGKPEESTILKPLCYSCYKKRY